VAGTSSLDQLEQLWAEGELPGATAPGAWTLHPTAESTALCLRRPQGPSLLMVRGRQIATREGLEVLAIGCASEIPDGLELEETILASLEADAIVVIPWGFGKWWFERGRHVARLLEGKLAQRIHLGDNGNRAALGPEPALRSRFSRAAILFRSPIMHDVH
jgi:hypothetical protein